MDRKIAGSFVDQKRQFETPGSCQAPAQAEEHDPPQSFAAKF